MRDFTKRDPAALDYRDAFANAPTAKMRSQIIENERRVARNTQTGIASHQSVNGIPLPYVTGAMLPSGMGMQSALFSLVNYIKSGFVFGEGNNEKEYSKKHYSVVFEDWKTRFGMPLEW